MLKASLGPMEIEYYSAIETEEYFNGASRRVLTLECPVETSVDALYGIVSNEDNIKSIQLTNTDEEITNQYTGYVLPLKLGIEPVLASPETPETPAMYEDRLVIKLGKRTYVEQALKNLGL